MKVVFLGPPGTGKGTQAKSISEILNIPNISTGNIFRQLAEENNPLGIEARDKYWGKGCLVPDNIVTDLVKERIQNPDCKSGFILDGFPRTLAQAKSLDKITKIDLVIFICSYEKEIIRRFENRLQCNNCNIVYGLEKEPRKSGYCDECHKKLVKRQDDNPEVLKQRLKIFYKNINPIVKFYEEKGILVEVNGEQEIEKVKEEILGKMQSK
ncbi:adenylate kinase [Candidatus Woesearchaeota archaeon]|nr:adenylate kinase [Candidatus Woesearchaeota archaeon]